MDFLAAVHLKAALFIQRFDRDKGEVLSVGAEDGSIGSELRANGISRGLAGREVA